eukprot:6120111-Ditylum_brightwellii.AAC.1
MKVFCFKSYKDRLEVKKYISQDNFDMYLTYYNDLDINEIDQLPMITEEEDKEAKEEQDATIPTTNSSQIPHEMMEDSVASWAF